MCRRPQANVNANGHCNGVNQSKQEGAIQLFKKEKEKKKKNIRGNHSVVCEHHFRFLYAISFWRVINRTHWCGWGFRIVLGCWDYSCEPHPARTVISSSVFLEHTVLCLQGQRCPEVPLILWAGGGEMPASSQKITTKRGTLETGR